jgi:predicted dehydrogenase
MIDVGFIGGGGMGLYQANNFAAVRGCRVAAVADPAPAASDNFAAQHQGVSIYEDYHDLLDSGIAAVVVAVPTGYHAKVASDCLRAGVPVLLEKPMARTVAQCRALNRVQAKTGTLLMVAHCRRYDAHWGTWGKAVRAGRLGFPVLWRNCSAGLGPGRWFMDDELGGGPLIDGAVHNYDFANMIFGDPESVVSSTLKLDPKVSAIDTGSAVVRYADDNQLLVSWSWSTRGAGMHDVIGPKGCLQFGAGGIETPAEDQGKYSYFHITKLDGKQQLLRGPADFGQMYRRQARHFLDCIKGRSECRTPGTEAIKAVAVAEAILKAGPKAGKQAVRW